DVAGQRGSLGPQFGRGGAGFFEHSVQGRAHGVLSDGGSWWRCGGEPDAPSAEIAPGPPMAEWMTSMQPRLVIAAVLALGAVACGSSPPASPTSPAPIPATQ